MIVGISTLMRITLPTRTVFITDGGFLNWNGDLYTSNDPVLGSIKAIDSASEEVAGPIPGIDVTFNAAGSFTLAEFSNGAIQSSEVAIYTAEYITDTNAIIGAPELQFIGSIDQPIIRYSDGVYEVTLTLVSHSEAIFESDTGNALSATFHKTIYPSELGHDNAIGLTIQTAFGTFSPPTSSPVSVSTGNNFSGALFARNVR